MDHPLFADIPAPSVLTVSGQEYWPVDLGDVRVLSDFHLIRAMGEGSLYVEIRGGMVTKYEPRPGGGARMLNSLLGLNNAKLRG